MKQPLKKLGYTLAGGFISGMGWALARTQGWLPGALCNGLSWIAWTFTSRRTVVLRNLHHAFPDQSEAWRERVGRMSMARMFELFLFPIALPYLSRDTLKRQFIVEPEHEKVMNDVIDSGPFVLQGPHVTLTESLVLLPLLFERMPQIVTLYRPIDFPPAEAHVKGARERFGVKLASRREGLLKARDSLLKGNAAAILFDQNARDIGALTLFFGRVCSATDLPGILISKTGAENILLYPRRLGFWRASVEVHRLGTTKDPATATAAAHYRLQTILQRDEETCADWLWSHQRWKIFQAPAERLNLDHKRSYLPRSMEIEGLDQLPRRTFYAFRLPADVEEARTFLPLIPEIRQSRPDAHLTLVHPEELALSSGLADAALPFTGDAPSVEQLAALKGHYLDAWFSLEVGEAGAAEGKAAGAHRSYGIGTEEKSRYAAVFVPDAAAGDPGTTTYYRAFLSRFGLRHPG